MIKIQEKIGKVLWQFGNKARDDLYFETHKNKAELIDLPKEHKKMIKKIMRIIKDKGAERESEDVGIAAMTEADVKRLR